MGGGCTCQIIYSSMHTHRVNRPESRVLTPEAQAAILYKHKTDPLDINSWDFYLFNDWRTWNVLLLCKVMWMICTYTSQSLCRFNTWSNKRRTKHDKCISWPNMTHIRILHTYCLSSSCTLLVGTKVHFMDYTVHATESIKRSWSTTTVSGGRILSQQWIVFKWTDESFSFNLFYYKSHVSKGLVFPVITLWDSTSHIIIHDTVQ